MFTILGVDGKEYGPVTTAQVKEWMHGGRANLQTPCRRADETAWKTIADFREPENGVRLCGRVAQIVRLIEHRATRRV